MALIEQLCASYDEALPLCGGGYEDDDISLVVAKKTEAIIPLLGRFLLDTDPVTISLLAVLSAARQASPVRVLDVGGGCGYHYFVVKALLPDIPLKWHVAETAAMSAQGKTRFANDDLGFFASVDEALAAFGGGIDLLHTSSTIQYVPDPEGFADRVTEIAAPHVMVARFPLFEGPRTVAVQASRLGDNGPGPAPEGTPDRIIRYPITFCNKDELAGRLMRGYRLAGQFASPSANYRIGDSEVTGASFLLRRES
jgi:putative methyltransferase (TIGR04325 family)